MERSKDTQKNSKTPLSGQAQNPSWQTWGPGGVFQWYVAQPSVCLCTLEDIKRQIGSIGNTFLWLSCGFCSKNTLSSIMPQAWKWSGAQFALHIRRYTWCLFTCYPHQDTTWNEVPEVNDLHIRNNELFLFALLITYLLHWGRPSQPGRCWHGDCILGASTSTSASQCAGGISSGALLLQQVNKGC